MSLVMVIVTTESHEQARVIAERVLQGRLAAGVNILPDAQTIYWGENELVKSVEHLLIFRTTQSKVALIGSLLAEVNQEIEISVVPVTQINPKYESWIQSTVNL